MLFAFCMGNGSAFCSTRENGGAFSVENRIANRSFLSLQFREGCRLIRGQEFKEMQHSLEEMISKNGCDKDMVLDLSSSKFTGFMTESYVRATGKPWYAISQELVHNPEESDFLSYFLRYIDNPGSTFADALLALSYPVHQYGAVGMFEYLQSEFEKSQVKH